MSIEQDILDSDISVVIQGNVTIETHNLVNQIRSLLPRSELILVTWIGNNVEGLCVNKSYYLEEPESYVQHKRSKKHNHLNHILRSTKVGIEHTNRKYVLKVRSDLQIDSLAFLKTFQKYPQKTDKTIFDHKVLVPILYSRISYRGKYTPFHVSDWACFGLKTDLLLWFSLIPEVQEPEFTKYFSNEVSRFGTTTFKMAPEQYFVSQLYTRFYRIEFDNCEQATENIQKLSNEFIVSNFIVADYKETGWFLNKYPESKDIELVGRAFFELWNRDNYNQHYQLYCNHQEIVKNSTYDDYNRRCTLLQIKKHRWKLDNANSFKKKCSELLILFCLKIKLALMNQ